MVCWSFPSAYRALKHQYNMAQSLMLPDKLAVLLAQHRHNHLNNNHNYRMKKPLPPSHSGSPTLCEQSSTAAIDILILVLVLGSCAFLFTPYFKYVCREVAEILPATFLFIGEVVYQAPVAYASGAILTVVSVIGGWEIYHHKSRKCSNPHCRGLKKAMEFDIQLETEQCVKASANLGEESGINRAFEPTPDQKELEAELKRMAPPNGRAVLIFRAPCGCPAARFEAWGSKKPRKSKK